MDNTTAHPASDYEVEVARTIPFHDQILRTAIEVALAARSTPARWLDTGAGPGKLVELAETVTPKTEFFIADPSEAMLAIARARHEELAADRFVHAASADLPALAPFDVITAIQCHHYGDAAARERAIVRCRDLLAPGGVLVVFENVRAETDAGYALQRARWGAWLKRARLVPGSAGSPDDDAAVKKQVAREGVAFFPIRPKSEHVALLTRVFGTNAMIEMVWRAFGQAGFVAMLAPHASGA